MEQPLQLTIDFLGLITAIIAGGYAASQFAKYKDEAFRLRQETKAKFIAELSASLGDEQYTQAVRLLESYRNELYAEQVRNTSFSTHCYVVLEERIFDVPSSMPAAVSSGMPPPILSATPSLSSSGSTAGANQMPFPAGASDAFIKAHNEITEDWSKVRNLLRFYEAILYMIETDVINERDVFRLLGYRILLALNCPLVQKRMLFAYDDQTQKVRPKYSFISLFALHNRLMEYVKYRFQWKDNKGVIFDLLLEDYKISPRYDLRHSAHLLWHQTGTGNTDVYQTALNAYAQFSDLPKDDIS